VTKVKQVCAALGMGLWIVWGYGSTAADVTSNTPASVVVNVWPGIAPGTADWTKSEKADDVQLPGAGRVVHVINSVTAPTLTVVRPAPGRATGAGMLVLPGGAFGALAWDLEGTEVARWLVDRGITAFVLKYRVYEPDPAMLPDIQKALSNPSARVRFDEFLRVLEPRRRIATDDALQAVRLVRSRAAEFGVVPNRIGMMGFSAGAITAMSAVAEGDAASRPDFAAPIYGAMLSDKAPKDGPPLFIAAATDDDTVPVDRSLAIYGAWLDAARPAELHIYETGGHGFGLGKPRTASATWTDAFEAWLSLHGLSSAGRD
jgi:acetyl esterase/lipase